MQIANRLCFLTIHGGVGRTRRKGDNVRPDGGEVQKRCSKTR